MNTPDRTGSILCIKDLCSYFPVYGGVFTHKINEIKAVDRVSFDVKEGSVIGIVGESGCGKTTLGRTIIRLLDPDGGQILYYPETGSEAVDLAGLGPGRLRKYRANIQMVFQDPFSSLNPRFPVADIVREPLTVHTKLKKAGQLEKTAQLLETVGLSPDYMYRYPHEFSGGQRQRVGIARALATTPRIVIADEPVSALDVSIQAQVINLMQDLQEKFGLTYLFIAHDISVVRHISDTIAVMYLGKVVETGPSEEVYTNPRHPYTEALLSAIPIPDPQRKADKIKLRGNVPSPLDIPCGCPFHPRCHKAAAICAEKVPEFREITNGIKASCHFAG